MFHINKYLQEATNKKNKIKNSQFARTAAKEARSRTLNVKDLRWKEENWSQMIMVIETAKIQRFHVDNNGVSTIIKDIDGNNFTNLTTFTLSNNGIKSIEHLARLKLPYLKKLDLSHNLITTIEPLSKANLRELINLNITHNPILNFQPMKKMEAKLSILQLVDFKDTFISSADRSFLVCMKSKYPNRVICASNGLRIDKIGKMIAQCFRNLILYDNLWI